MLAFIIYKQAIIDATFLYLGKYSGRIERSFDMVSYILTLNFSVICVDVIPLNPLCFQGKYP